MTNLTKHLTAFYGDKFSEIPGDVLRRGFREKMQVPESTSFETLRLIFQELARIFWQSTEKDLKIVVK